MNDYILAMAERYAECRMQSTDSRQRPYTYGSLGGQALYLTNTAVRPISASNLTEQDAFQATQDINTVAAWDIFLARYSSGFYADLAVAARKQLLQTAVTPITPSPRQNRSVDQGFVFPDSHRRRLRTEELNALSKAYLRIARNEIFARLGRHFKSADLKNHFSRYSWYQPYTWKPRLNAIEKYNVNLIKAEESRR